MNRSKLGKFTHTDTHTHINQTNISNNQWKKEKKSRKKKITWEMRKYLKINENKNKFQGMQQKQC